MLNTTAALFAVYDRALAEVEQSRDIDDRLMEVLLQLFDEKLIQALYLVDRGAVRLIDDSTSLLLAEVHSRHPEPVRLVALAPSGQSTSQDWCECAEFSLVAGGMQGASGASPHTFPLPVCVHLLAGQLALRLHRSVPAPPSATSDAAERVYARLASTLLTPARF